LPHRSQSARRKRRNLITVTGIYETGEIFGELI
jgi:hypothetical protein